MLTPVLLVSTSSCPPGAMSSVPPSDIRPVFPVCVITPSTVSVPVMRGSPSHEAQLAELRTSTRPFGPTVPLPRLAIVSMRSSVCVPEVPPSTSVPRGRSWSKKTVYVPGCWMQAVSPEPGTTPDVQLEAELQLPLTGAAHEAVQV